MNRRWVVNVSPLIVLANISQIHLLSKLCGDIVVPNGVVVEINVAPDDCALQCGELVRPLNVAIAFSQGWNGRSGQGCE